MWGKRFRMPELTEDSERRRNPLRKRLVLGALALGLLAALLLMLDQDIDDGELDPIAAMVIFGLMAAWLVDIYWRNRYWRDGT